MENKVEMIDFYSLHKELQKKHKIIYGCEYKKRYDDEDNVIDIQTKEKIKVRNKKSEYMHQYYQRNKEKWKNVYNPYNNNCK